MELYHGTNFKSAVDICKNGIDFSKGGVNLDFGVGFYTTPDLKKAIQRARSKARYQEEEAYIVVLTMDEQKMRRLKYRVFEIADEKWGEFIINNRCGRLIVQKDSGVEHNLDNRYDIVEGQIADGSVSRIAYNVREGKDKIENVDYRQFLPNEQKTFGQQISFHTEKALNCIKELKYFNIKQIALQRGVTLHEIR